MCKNTECISAVKRHSYSKGWYKHIVQDIFFKGPAAVVPTPVMKNNSSEFLLSRTPLTFCSVWMESLAFRHFPSPHLVLYHEACEATQEIT